MTGRILIIATGTIGDVAPLVAVAQGLQGKYEVDVLTHEEYVDAFISVGATSRLGVLPHQPSEIFASVHGLRSMEGGCFGIRRLRGLYGLVRWYAPDLLRAIEAGVASGGVDLIVTSGPTPGVERLALAHGVAVRRIQFQPTWPSADTRSLYISKRQPHSRLAIRLGNAVVKRATPMIFELALRGSGIPARLYPELDESHRLSLTTWFAFPLSLGTASTMVPPARHIGFLKPTWSQPDAASSTPADALETLAAHRRAGRSVIFIGFGSMRTKRARREAALLARAALRRGYAVAWQSAEPIPSDLGPETCVPVPSMDHRGLFPLVDAVVCHGGINTCAAALSTKRPLIVVPQWLDQYFWAGRFEEAGVAVAAQRRLRTLGDAVRLFRKFETFRFRAPGPDLCSADGLESILQDVPEILEAAGSEY